MNIEFEFLVDNLLLLPIFQAISLLNSIYTRIIKRHDDIVEFLRMMFVLVAGGSETTFYTYS